MWCVFHPYAFMSIEIFRSITFEIGNNLKGFVYLTILKDFPSFDFFSMK